MRAAAYIRVSTEEQAQEGFSIAAQRRALAAFCESQGWGPPVWYVDDGYSGKSLDRPEIQRLVADVRERLVDVVLVWKVDRLSRRQRHLLHLLEEVFEPAGCGFRSITQPFDTTTAFGRAMLGVLGVFAQLERDQIVERTKMGKAESARSGRHVGRPYGYRRTPGGLVVVEQEAEVVRQIFAQYGVGWGLGRIAEDLAARGVPSPKAGIGTKGRRPAQGGWHMNIVRYILANPTYAGLVPHRGSAHEGRQQAIIDASVWRAVQSELDRRSREKYRAPSDAYLLSGLAWCGICGSRLRGRRQWANWPHLPKRWAYYYVCRRHNQDRGLRDARCDLRQWRLDDLDAAVMARVRALAWDEGALREHVEQALREDAAASARTASAREQAQASLADVEARIRRWERIIEADDLADADEVRARLRELLTERRRLQGLARSASPAAPSLSASVEAGVASLRRFAELFDDATPEERRQLVREVVSRVTVYSDRIEVETLPALTHR